MHKNILSDSQQKLLPLLTVFSPKFYLAGGTAIALHLGHRKSIDFDLFTDREFSNSELRKKIVTLGSKIEHVLIDKKDEYTVVIDGVKVTFLLYDFEIRHQEKFETYITLPDLVTLAAMKAYALGRRAKWKDYVDLYFIGQKYKLSTIVKQSKKIFGPEFNEKNFRVQLSYFDDIDYSEQVDYLPNFLTKNKEIEEFLTEYSLQ